MCAVWGVRVAGGEVSSLWRYLCTSRSWEKKKINYHRTANTQRKNHPFALGELAADFARFHLNRTAENGCWLISFSLLAHCFYIFESIGGSVKICKFIFTASAFKCARSERTINNNEIEQISMMFRCFISIKSKLKIRLAPSSHLHIASQTQKQSKINVLIWWSASVSFRVFICWIIRIREQLFFLSIWMCWMCVNGPWHGWHTNPETSTCKNVRVALSHVYHTYMRNKWTGGWTTIESYACVCANFQQISMFTFWYVLCMKNISHLRRDGDSNAVHLFGYLSVPVGLNSKIEITDSIISSIFIE